MKKIYILSIGVLFFMFSLSSFSMFVGNTSGKSFEEEESSTTSKSYGTYDAVTVEDLIIKAATYFLKGKSSVYLLSANLEAADEDKIYYYDYQITVNEALNYMRMAHYYYTLLKVRADITPYNQEIIAKLKSFDYNTLSKSYGLNSDIFSKVKSYLEAGDVRGVYAQFLAYTESIINTLETIQKSIYYWNFPKIETIWNLNQECAQMLLFGQYVSRVFYKL